MSKQKPINRARVSSAANQQEVAYFTKRGRSELNLTGKSGRFYIQEVSASPSGSYWDTVEVAGNEDYAVNRAQSLALTEGRSIRVAKVVKEPKS